MVAKSKWIKLLANPKTWLATTLLLFHIAVYFPSFASWLSVLLAAILTVSLWARCEQKTWEIRGHFWRIIHKNVPGLNTVEKLIKLSVFGLALVLLIDPVTDLCAYCAVLANNWSLAKNIYLSRPTKTHPNAIFQLAATQRSKQEERKFLQFYLEVVKEKYGPQDQGVIALEGALAREFNKRSNHTVTTNCDIKCLSYIEALMEAGACQKQGKVIEATKFYEQSLATAEHEFGARSDEVAYALDIYASSLELQHRERDAATLRARRDQIVTAKENASRERKALRLAILDFILAMLYFGVFSRHSFLANKALKVADKKQIQDFSALHELTTVHLFRGNLTQACNLSEKLMVEAERERGD